MQGLQYETVNLGPPKPPCNEERLATLKALECTDGPTDPELGVPTSCLWHCHQATLQAKACASCS